MTTFKPKTSLWKKIVGNPGLQIAVVFVLVFSAIFYIRQARRAELLARVEYLKGGPVLVGRNTGESRLDADEALEVTSLAMQDSASQGIDESAPPPPDRPANSATLRANSFAASISKDNKLGAANNLKLPIKGPKITVKYLEIERSVLDAWLNEMRTAGTLKTFDGVSVGVLPQVITKLNSARGFKVLQTTVSPAQVGTTEWFMGTHRSEDLENEIGLFSSLLLTEVTDSLIRGDFEMQRAFRDPRDPNKTMERISFGSAFEVGSNAGYILSGVLPQRFISELPEGNKADAALSAIFKSRPFQMRETDLAVVLEIDTAPAK
jgi:hypothetical protein